ncbi:hypothetical protein [Segetibacter aerophilus]|uniref:Outer membrane protein beta-barrel domain-containing protein n=1 Tax=Segetibacter aerophilus TaxID=670293 RepID=A0A512BJI0_9BACT|nr:hypothetical protein [Segetibacter aerophilus]GEO12118.1 hypothetical protein SAE01_46140 [Segetibacter aerophilus]
MKVLLFVCLFCSAVANGQVAYVSPTESVIPNSETFPNSTSTDFQGRKLFKKNTGMIIGLQRGKYNSIELGGEAHWRKISLLKPHIIGATANLEYNFENNVIGYKAGMWMKRGRINLTYGANVSYFTNFKEGNRFGFGPSIGFRLLGLHLINGYNFLTKDKTEGDDVPIEVNSLYMSLRYYFPVTNSFTWDRKTMKKKRERQKARAERKKEREKNKDDGKSFWNKFKFGKKD